MAMRWGSVEHFALGNGMYPHDRRRLQRTAVAESLEEAGAVQT
jgi:hypothetical protein